MPSRFLARDERRMRRPRSPITAGIEAPRLAWLALRRQDVAAHWPRDEAPRAPRRCRWRSAASRASSSLDLHVDEGEIVSVIGPNGAGKTTLFNLVTGVYEPIEGDILFAGESITGLEPHKITRKGIARTFQTLRLFLNMTVRENVMAAAYGHTRAGALRSILRTPGQRREEREIRALAEERLAFFGERLMGYRWDQPAYSLSYANRRRLEIARATATNPRLLLLDEPAAGMNPKETQEITELIAKLRDGGRLHDPRDRARHARRRGDLRPRRRPRPRRQDRRGLVRATWPPTRAWSRPTSGPGGRRGNERDRRRSEARRSSSSRASTPTTGRSTSSRTRTSSSARESSSACSAGTRRGSRRR